MNIQFGFSIIGVMVFLLPMLINIVYVILPPVNMVEESKENNKVLEIIEQVSRVLFAIAICILVSKDELDFSSPLLYIGLAFLLLYYLVWIRYFIKGRDVALLGEKFLFVPMPLAIFPVVYFAVESIWMQNYIALAVMIVFGIAHNINSYRSLYVINK